METMTVLAILGSISVLGGVVAYVAKMWLKPDEFAGKLKKNMVQYVSELEEDNKILRKKMNAMKKGVSLSPEDAEDPMSAISALLPQFEHLVPAKFKPFLRDPQLMQYATKMIKENPEAAKNIINKFVSKKGTNTELAGNTEETQMSV